MTHRFILFIFYCIFSSCCPDLSQGSVDIRLYHRRSCFGIDKCELKSLKSHGFRLRMLRYNPERDHFIAEGDILISREYIEDGCSSD